MINLGLKSHIDFKRSPPSQKIPNSSFYHSTHQFSVSSRILTLSLTFQKMVSNLNQDQDTIRIILINQDQRFLLFGYLKPPHPH